MKKLKQKYKVVLIIVILVVSVIYYIDKTKEEFNKEDTNEILELNTVKEADLGESQKNNPNEQENNIENEEILVHISGEVKNAGVYSLLDGDRITDAINQAGGLTEEADTSQINLAYKVEDGMKIDIPKKGEKTEDLEGKIQEEKKEFITKESGIKNSNINEKITKEAEETTTKSKVNINTATVQELDTLPGIGESTAQKIIKYRKEKGKFMKIEDIKEVSGIGESKFEKIKDMICI